MPTVLIVVDMLEGFCREGYPLFCGEDAVKIIPFVKRKIEEYDERGLPVIFLADNHDPDDKEFEMFPPHCVKGTKEAEVLPELFNAVRKKVLIPKNRFSGFHNTSLELYLNGFVPEVVEVVGVCTNICVFFTVEGLRNRDFKVRVYREGVASFDRHAHNFALQQMEKVLGAEVV
jgi:nicotinamidase/pyrazinamidase